MYNKLANKLSKKRLASKFYIDLSLFRNTKLSPAEVIVKFLKENQNLGYREISRIIGRDERNVWTLYNRSKKKI